MSEQAPPGLPPALTEWCHSVLGRCEAADVAGGLHPARSSLHLLRAASGECYLKTYNGIGPWQAEVHAYERWAPALGALAPRLVAVRAEEPLAILISRAAGRPLERAGLPPGAEATAWEAAGAALRLLHGIGGGAWFGPCRRDGACAGVPVYDAVEHIRGEMDALLRRADAGAALDAEERTTAHAAREQAEVFAGEHPTACHRDWCPTNWLVDRNGALTGVVDFEFSRWDVRTADLSRLPGWEWLERPHLVEALRKGYGKDGGGLLDRQVTVSLVLYSVDAVVWGLENGYTGYADEGRRALAWLGPRLRRV